MASSDSHSDSHSHVPLSECLEQLLAEEAAGRALTMNRLLVDTQGRGMYFLIVLLGLPFTPFFSIPGFSGLIGTVILLLSLRLTLDLPPRLPRFIGERSLPPALKKTLGHGGVKMLRLIEKGIKPRGTHWLYTRTARCGNGLLLALLALLLALPLPIPFTNTLPSYAIIFVALSMMEGDGRMIWLGYVTSAGTLVFFGLCTERIVALFVKYHDQVQQWLRSWL